MKKIMALALALVMVLGTFTACGSSNDSNGSDDAGNTATGAKVIEINLTEEQYAFGVDKNQPELLDDVNAFIKKKSPNSTFRPNSGPGNNGPRRPFVGRRMPEKEALHKINEYITAREVRIVGEGVIAWPEILKLVKQHGYDGWLSMEYERRWHPDDIPDASIGMKKGAEYIKSIM